MSLHELANHLQTAGRGEDKMLVHMTPAEVGGLQTLAEKHGGSLTVNPHTGLPEAGFLSAILPMIAGFALGPAGFGLMSSLGAAATVGGIDALATGSLQKGLMAGLGAYGGAGLGEGLTDVGAEVNGAANAGAASSNLGAQGAAFNPTEAALQPSNFGATAGNTTAEAVTKAAESGGLTGYQGYNSPAAQSAMYNPAVADAQWAANPNSIPAQNVVNPEAFGQGANMNYGAQQLGSAANATPPNSIDQIMQPQKSLSAGLSHAGSGLQGIKDVYNAMPPYSAAALGASTLGSMQPQGITAQKPNQGMIRPYTYSANPTGADLQPYSGSAERTYFQPVFTAGVPYEAPGPEYKKASGGLASFAVGGPVETMSAQNAVGANQMYPQAGLQTSMYSNPETQRPMSVNVLSPESDVAVDPYTGEQKFAMGGGISSLGSYSDGGHLLKGPGDGVSDSIPAEIGGHQPARLADGEFVVPARIVSELGNGSTEAGARKLYAMMDRVQNSRKKSIGKNKVAVDSKAVNQLPA